MNKKVLFSVLLIILVTGVAVFGTDAYFTANRTTSANKFSAGTMDLDVSSNGNKLEPFVIDNIGISSELSGEKTWVVRNSGTLPGRLLLRLQNLENTDNGCNDQEAFAEPACAVDDEGELGKAISLKISLNGNEVAQSLLGSDQADLFGTKWNQLTPIVLAAGEEANITAHWSVDQSAYGNEVQSDSVRFDLNFRLVQKIDGEL
ncbi:hypothetical protein CVU83_00065 [Candidatus Falkowbacteria bacterium HGW-Falkowbacteria-2]|uniref:Uncharacterized protein n=1 Tax=Candidatus Falkowbacteria bacterium HGW-Falkowbacteria-2 TaxID=2013769 RepID=A0A2N2E416_9BACT|nr:MAG: hypothetical protein CVU83_00065 [Candidatus Falkowbacteria bacterium HGW-Falkowbacteria-2]